MALLLEVKLIGSEWIPREVLEDTDIHEALRNINISKKYIDWRVKRISEEDIPKINALIIVHWSI